MATKADDGSTPEEVATQEQKVTSKYTHVFLDIQRGLACLQQDGVGTDFEVKVEDQTFRVHKAVLASVSDFFRAMIESGMKEASENKTTLENVSITAFKAILDILYLKDGDVDPLHNKSDDELAELLRVADMMQIKSLRKLCIDLFEKTMTAKNCIARWKIANDIFNDDLRNMAYRFHIKHFEKIAKVGTMSCLEYRDFRSVIASKQLVVNNEISVWHAISEWIDFDRPTRQEKLGQLLKLCYLKDIDLKILTEDIAFDIRVRQDTIASDAVRAAIKFLNHPGSHGHCTLQHRDGDDKEQVSMLLGFYENDETLSVLMCRAKTDDSFIECTVPDVRKTAHFACCVHGRDVYVSGGTGRHSTLMHKYSGLTDHWTLCKSVMHWTLCKSVMPVDLKRHVMLATDDSLYVLGGRSDVGINANVLRYCLSSEQWYSDGEIEAAVENASAVCEKGKIWIFGGQLSGNELGQSTDCIQMYDTNKKMGYVMPCNLPTPCSFSRAIPVGNDDVIIVTDKGEVIRFSMDRLIQAKLQASIPDFVVEKVFGITKVGKILAIYGVPVNVENEQGSRQIFYIDPNSGRVLGKRGLPTDYRLCCSVNIVVQSEMLNV